MSDLYETLIRAAFEKSYISIAINEDGKWVGGMPIPWESTTSAFKMRRPKIAVSVEEIGTDEVRELLRACRVIGCYCLVPLEDYSFISDFRQLEDLSIRRGESIRDLKFIENLDRLGMLYVENASIPDLKPLLTVGRKISGGFRLGLFKCSVQNTSALSEWSEIISELLIWPAEGDSRERWRTKEYPWIMRFYEQRID